MMPSTACMGKAGDAVSPIAALHPAALVGNAIDRGALKAWIARDPAALKRIEGVVHPLVVMDRNRFLANATADIVLLDIPLLFETGAESSLDATLVVTAPSALQRSRVLARPGMTAGAFRHHPCQTASRSAKTSTRHPCDRDTQSLPLSAPA